MLDMLKEYVDVKTLVIVLFLLTGVLIYVFYLLIKSWL